MQRERTGRACVSVALCRMATSRGLSNSSLLQGSCQAAARGHQACFHHPLRESARRHLQVGSGPRQHHHAEEPSLTQGSLIAPPAVEAQDPQ